MNVAGSLVRRGLEAHATHGDKVRDNFPVWGAILIGGTAIVYLVAMFTIEYTFGRVLPTLLIIESPQDSIAFEPLPTEDIDSNINKDPEQAPRPTLITSSFRRTLRHLGGFQARFRGISVFCVNAFLVNSIVQFLSALPLLQFIPRGLIAVGAAVICAQFSLAWTHIVISQPSQKTWFRRFPPAKMWKKVAIPTAVLAFAEQFSVYVPVYTSILMGQVHASEDLVNTPHKRMMMSLMAFGVLITSLLLSFLLVIPANVALTRVQASLLSDAEETIVPFDRSFGGKVIPEIVGGSGVIGMLEAWKSFDWAARVRLVKAYLKVVAMQVATTILFMLVIFAQFFIVAGRDWSKFMPEDGNKGKVDV